MDDLDKFLSKRMTPKPRPGLAGDIVERALQEDLRSGFSLFNTIAEIFKQNFILPQPGVAFACALLLGIWLGLSYDLDVSTTTYEVEDVALSLVIDDVWNAEDML